MAQSYANAGGSGDRRGPIVITTTATAGAGGVTNLIDGAQANAYWWNPGGQTGREIRFDFNAVRLVTEAKWYQDNATTHGTWQWQGSPDGSAWTNIGATFTLGGTAQVITTLSGNVTAYRYYRMLQTAGGTSTSPYLREIEFLIDDPPAAFVPSPDDPYFVTNTVLLCHADGANGSTTFTDTTTRHTLAAVNTAAVSTTQARFGTGSATFPSGSDSVNVPGNLGDFDFQSGQFTIECWGWLTSTPSNAALAGQYGAGPAGWALGCFSSSYAFLYYDPVPSLFTLSGGSMPATGAWHHYAVDRDASGIVRLYIDGVIRNFAVAPTFRTSAPQTLIGNNPGGGNVWPGYVDEVRVTKGVCRYGQTFTAPAAAFPDGLFAASASQARAMILA